MNELERKLVELGRTLRPPHTPTVAQRVAGQLRREQTRSRRRWRGGAALAFATAVVLVGAVTVPLARTALLRFFHLGGISVERVDELPPVTPRARIAPGRDVGLARASRLVPFTLVVPGRDPVPTHVFYDGENPPGGQVTLIYGSVGHPRLLVSEFIGTDVQGAFLKRVGRRTSVERVQVDGGAGIWLGGRKHAFSFLDDAGMTREWETRLAANTLVWQRGDLTIRLEGELGKSDAIRLAESFEPRR